MTRLVVTVLDGADIPVIMQHIIASYLVRLEIKMCVCKIRANIVVDRYFLSELYYTCVLINCVFDF